MARLRITDIDQDEKRQHLIDKIAEVIEAVSWRTMADRYRAEPDKREWIARFIGRKIAKKSGEEQGRRFVALATATTRHPEATI